MAESGIQWPVGLYTSTTWGDWKEAKDDVTIPGNYDGFLIDKNEK